MANLNGTSMTVQQTITSFLNAKVRSLAARSQRLVALTPADVGLRRQDLPFAPLRAHFKAANHRLAVIDRDIRRRLSHLQRHWRTALPGKVLTAVALVEKEIDRARRAFGMFFDIFSQRGTAFAPALAAHDAIAADCYAAVRQAAPHVFKGRLLKPFTYLESGYSPATMRRGISLSRLLGEANPFPIIRIPWDRDNPWQAVFLHEVAHNLQADLGVWQENKNALQRRMLMFSSDPILTTVYGRWHKEIFADMASVLLGGPASVWGAMDFLAHPSPKTMTYRPGGAHPTGYLRVLILAELLRRMGFGEDAGRVQRVWNGLYNPGRGHRIPVRLLASAFRVIPQVVDEIVFQPRRNLGQRALADVIQFSHEDEKQIRRGAKMLMRRKMPADLPPRFMVSASRYALQQGAPLQDLSRRVIDFLSKRVTNQSHPSIQAGLLAAGGEK